MNKNLNYENIVEVAHTDNKEKANGYLKLNWVLLNVESLQFSEHGWTTSFVFGWHKDSGEVKHPEKTEWEKLLETTEKDPAIPV